MSNEALHYEIEQFLSELKEEEIRVNENSGLLYAVAIYYGIIEDGEEDERMYEIFTESNGIDDDSDYWKGEKYRQIHSYWEGYYFLANCLYEGRGVEQDVQKAIKYLQLAVYSILYSGDEITHLSFTLNSVNVAEPAGADKPFSGFYVEYLIKKMLSSFIDAGSETHAGSEIGQKMRETHLEKSKLEDKIRNLENEKNAFQKAFHELEEVHEKDEEKIKELENTIKDSEKQFEAFHELEEAFEKQIQSYEKKLGIPDENNKFTTIFEGNKNVFSVENVSDYFDKKRRNIEAENDESLYGDLSKFGKMSFGKLINAQNKIEVELPLDVQITDKQEDKWLILKVVKNEGFIIHLNCNYKNVKEESIKKGDKRTEFELNSGEIIVIEESGRVIISKNNSRVMYNNAKVYGIIEEEEKMMGEIFNKLKSDKKELIDEIVFEISEEIKDKKIETDKRIIAEKIKEYLKSIKKDNLLTDNNVIMIAEKIKDHIIIIEAEVNVYKNEYLVFPNPFLLEKGDADFESCYGGLYNVINDNGKLLDSNYTIQMKILAPCILDGRKIAASKGQIELV